MKSNPLFASSFLLQRMAGKGGWTYITLPAVPKEYRGQQSAVKVSGSIDQYELKNINLWSTKSGDLFMPVKAEIRKAIGKEVGDSVEVILYADHEPVNIREELIACLEDEPAAYKTFLSCSDTEQNLLVDWIQSARNEEIKIERMAKAIDQLIAGIRPK